MLKFKVDDHSYWVNDRQLPSVTEIIRFLNVDIIGSANKEAKEAAAERGTRIHEACTAYDFGDDECDGDIVGYIKAYADFKRDYGVKDWSMFETIVGNEHYAGTLDRYGKIDGVTTVLDIKTGSKLHMKTHVVQLAGYTELLLEDRKPVEQGAILHLKKDGAYTLKIVDIDELCDAYLIFRRCLELHNYLKKGA